jgi:hypothetical protein
MVTEILGTIALPTVAEGDVEMPLAIEHQP